MQLSHKPSQNNHDHLKRRKKQLQRHETETKPQNKYIYLTLWNGMCAAAPHLNIIVLVTLRQIISREKKEQNDFLTTKQTPCVCRCHVQCVQKRKKHYHKNNNHERSHYFATLAKCK